MVRSLSAAYLFELEFEIKWKEERNNDLKKTWPVNSKLQCYVVFFARNFTTLCQHLIKKKITTHISFYSIACILRL